MNEIDFKYVQKITKLTAKELPDGFNSRTLLTGKLIQFYANCFINAIRLTP